MKANRIVVLGVDPGLANMGWSVVELRLSTDALLACGVQRTEKSEKKRQVLASDDNLRRAREMAAALVRVFDAYPIAAICAESMSYPRNAVAAAKMAMCWGTLAAFAQVRNLSVVQSSPQEIKKALCANKSASKEDVAEAVRNRFPKAEELLKSLPAGVHEHAYDATAAVLAALQGSEVIRILRHLAA